MDIPIIKNGLLLIATLLLFGCNAFMHGYTWKKANNSYHAVNGNKDNFGDKRLRYNKGFHKKSALANFLNCNCNSRGLPGFIYEYRTVTKCRGIQLFYPKLDSVFIFEEPAKGKLTSVLKEARKMNDNEHQIFEQLKTGRN